MSITIAWMGSVAGQCGQFTHLLEGLSSVGDAMLRHEVATFIPYDAEGDTSRADLIAVSGEPDGRERVILDGTGVHVTIERAPFDSTKHTLTWDRGSQRYLCAIDGRKFHGTDGDAPFAQISGLRVRIDGKEVAVPDSAWTDLYNPNLWGVRGKERTLHLYAEAARSKGREHVFVHMTNSDGAGGYDVVWILVHGKYRQRVVSMP